MKAVADSVQTCKLQANKLRSLADTAGDANVQKMLLVAAHHLDVAVAELDYIITSATVST